MKEMGTHKLAKLTQKKKSELIFILYIFYVYKKNVFSPPSKYKSQVYYRSYIKLSLNILYSVDVLLRSSRNFKRRLRSSFICSAVLSMPVVAAGRALDVVGT